MSEYLHKYWSFARFTITTLVLPLSVICLVSSIGLTTGNRRVGWIMLDVGVIAALVFYTLGLVGMAAAKALTSPHPCPKAQANIRIIVGFATWGAALYATIVIPAHPWVDFDRLHQPSPDEAVACAALKQLGGDLEIDYRGHITSVALHDMSDDALSPLRDLQFVFGLSVDGPRVTDRAVAHFLHMRYLEYLSLARTGVTDECLGSLSELSHIDRLDLSDTKVTDSGLPGLAELSFLQELWLSGTKISDSGMLELGKLRGLQRLHLGGTTIHGQELQELRHLELIELDLARTGIMDDALVSIEPLQTLEQLDVSHTAITDAGMVHIAALKDLRNLKLTGTQITDTGLLPLVRLSKLWRLSVCGTRVTEGGVKALLKSNPKCLVDFGPENPVGSENADGHEVRGGAESDAAR
jgi:hypothetical protein